MLWKLSLTGIKSRLRDYLVLFSGLVMASAIFYMFESMASNEAFLTSNSTISSTVIIFRLGSVLLSIITFVYILYANSFLMTMRQKDYAMFMMLGAKGRKIAQMIFSETFIVGILATLVGSVVGMGLTSIVSHLLVQQLNIKISHFSPFSVHGLLITIVFFSILFLLAAIVNAFSIVKKPILTLIRADQTPTQMKQHKFLFFLEVVLGIASLTCGYYMMQNLEKFQLFGIVIALVTIVLGTYFIFHSVIIFCLSLLKKADGIALRKLNNFTLSQLSFRIREYTQMLSMVAMLFALALGALTVGLGFKNEISKMTNSFTVYDVVLNNAQKIDQQEVAKLDPKVNASYTQKEDEQTIYYLSEQFEQMPFIVKEGMNGDRNIKPKNKEITATQLAQELTLQDSLREYELPEQQPKEIKLVSQEEFSQLNLPETTLQLIQVTDFDKQLSNLEKLVAENKANNEELKNVDYSFTQKADVYNTFNSMFSGFEFMGFFLGLAFLTMLASCLMFKILSGSKSDQVRYEMLQKIGTRQGLLTQSIRREIGVLFLAPGLLGVVHVLFGLQMFKLLMSDPYDNLWLPFTIFFVLYFVYYVITTWLYTGIVLKKKA
ncbi:permease [Enterococcus thailandicus]|uniref:FtsX-like permease family protein n=1 Tax=Enterococcus TaxID=1350 RepID=UPI00094C5AD1|nr:ABC transporter permease [Enterococcus thailandicus]MDK4353405.1 ABC transporter permease [Enterococcus thailandicus]MDT2735379.1 ABC transporter permease [Enterococcus thailandicus]MEA4828849.1 ABC transporter permease [Enterococcus thailandicus]GMC03199.1 permease [Enterococcus thailandicus]GMC10362.1 permease [Enterococcus thailandicus]